MTGVSFRIDRQFLVKETFLNSTVSPLFKEIRGSSASASALVAPAKLAIAKLRIAANVFGQIRMGILPEC
jgi:hypothetical protein